jgi:hypothetical protein
MVWLGLSNAAVYRVAGCRVEAAQPVSGADVVWLEGCVGLLQRTQAACISLLHVHRHTLAVP